jgi:hypothetical protein
MVEKKVRYRGRKRYPVKKKNLGISFEEIAKEYPSLSKAMFKGTPKKKKTIWDILFLLFLIVLTVGIIYLGIKSMIGVWKW